MMLRAAVVVLFLTAPSVADEGFNGQSFLDASQAFGEGYAFGYLDHEVSIVGINGEYLPYQLRFQRCFLGTGFTSRLWIGVEEGPR